ADPRIHLFLATSPLHMEYKLKMTEQEVLESAAAMTAHAKKYCDNIEFSDEDATRSDWDFLVKVVDAVIRAGATTVNIPDTVGYTSPAEMTALIQYLREKVPDSDKAIFSVHCHNDLGLAVANSLSAVKNGARQVEGAINGLGERGGNAALEEVVMALKTRQDFYRCGTTLDTTKLVTTSRLVSRLTGVPVNPNKPIVGANAFAHESGIHQHGVLANRETYEIMRAEDVGAEAAVMVLGKHSGRHAFQDRLTQLGYTLEKDDLNKAFAAFKSLCDEKKEVSDGDIEALVVEIISTAPERRYTLGSYEIECGTAIIGGPTARVVLKTADDKEHCDAAVGNGPIDAAYIAMQRITNLALSLENFQIAATSHASDSVGEAQVTVRHPGTGLAASGRGISTDTVRAAIMAYVSAVNNLYMVAAAKEVKINGN
ncbi:MAG: 2-isopropylmalate synthase, partial [Planctomycetes bacterium]|nr:2-isopropylmalate synthase [Planctomycetota bacterium]